MTIKKHSKKRDAILECIRSTDSHPTAEWIYGQLKPRIPDLSLGTVYRNLAEFRREGMILAVGAVDGSERFDGNVSAHSHFICKCCGRVIDVAGIALPEGIADGVGCGAVTDCTLTFHGICHQCAEQRAE